MGQPLTTQTFDDGTTVTYGADGNPVSYTDTSGYTYGPDKSVLGDYARTAGNAVVGAFANAVRDAFAPPRLTVAPAAAPIQKPAVNWLGVGLGVVVAVFAVRALRGG